MGWPHRCHPLGRHGGDRRQRLRRGEDVGTANPHLRPAADRRRWPPRGAEWLDPAAAVRSRLLRSADTGGAIRLTPSVAAIHLVPTRSILGELAFAGLRDGYGTTQVVWRRNESPEAVRETLESLSPESVVSVHGTVQARPADMQRVRCRWPLVARSDSVFDLG